MRHSLLLSVLLVELFFPGHALAFDLGQMFRLPPITGQVPRGGLDGAVMPPASLGDIPTSPTTVGRLYTAQCKTEIGN